MKTRKLRIGLLVLLIISATSVVFARNVCAFGFCETCSGQCVQESWLIYDKCINKGYTSYYCNQERLNYNWDCHTIFCPGCTVYHN